MAYVKTAKDIAWDKERNKLKSEISDWIRKCGEKEHTIQCQIGQIEILRIALSIWKKLLLLLLTER